MWHVLSKQPDREPQLLSLHSQVRLSELPRGQRLGSLKTRLCVAAASAGHEKPNTVFLPPLWWSRWWIWGDDSTNGWKYSRSRGCWRVRSKWQVDLSRIFYTERLSECQVCENIQSLIVLQKYHGERFLVSISVLWSFAQVENVVLL